ncbi:uncharacterized protein [Halyomorpha halys]|uniref:uncharacterized protein n=1 Tax=Halyomorpha halys TaxID=286706 RepID=UPI0006D511FF|nr:uncharacterized protein LOC106679597 [Halyomorpha halys]XP_014274328.1 uncharacterized protein LOC106679597 [Halyomorpha halys]XP_014274329.1 uncharacterized protein LOC106679597 [Halyomorpha halys]XP_014274330.1 uncharacterized protein LOC106679597 [Halyomorpha halys]XP_014274331.1 uncharacterized protein LOC106679597 [Halyomorpha halys]
MERQVLEEVLKKFDSDESVTKLLDISIEPALKKGENYMSDIIRVKTNVVLGNGRTIKRSFIIKKKIEGYVMNDVAKELDIFRLEAMMYNVVLKEMEYIMKEFEDTGEVIWCQLYDQGPTFLLMEDLKASGYILADRKTGLGLEDGQYILHNLARYHAMAKVLEVRELITKGMVKPFIVLNNRPFIKGIIHSGMVTFSKAIKESWGSSWEDVAEKINIPFDTLCERLKELGKLDETKFNVLNHGDVWPNNIMMKYNWKNKPVALKILDWQLSHYNSCCFDVMFFLFYSIMPSIRRSNLELLLKCYHGSLIQSLDKFGYTGKKPTLEDLTLEFERVSFLGYCLYCSEFPALVTDLMDGYDIGGVMDDGSEGGYSMDVYKDERLIDKIGPDIRIFAEKFL